MDTRSHYKTHLSRIYSWIFGDFSEMVERQRHLFVEHSLTPKSTKVAIDLGSGPGFQSIALEQLGFSVHAVDLCEELLDELRSKSSSVRTHLSDIRDLSLADGLRPELIVCMGDTITHLDSLGAVSTLIEQSYRALIQGGKFLISFRNLSQPAAELDRFILVKGDENRILTCFLEDSGEKVRVFDLLNERTGGQWNLSKSSYMKLKLTPSWLESVMTKFGFKVDMSRLPNGMHVALGRK
jgi:SAM-dependent methyltransferase